MSDNEQNNDEQVPPTEPVEDSPEETTDEAGEPSLADEAADLQGHAGACARAVCVRAHSLCVCG